jgi:hypothetical protein
MMIIKYYIIKFSISFLSEMKSHKYLHLYNACHTNRWVPPYVESGYYYQFVFIFLTFHVRFSSNKMYLIILIEILLINIYSNLY